ncbi:hypothetical protein KFK09_028553 [Dendrobium nobile]|uniref:Uncharacterized protein n=1 Tax=Dendrobium nobile TaxID=94219 RepID=A0A8T3A276_DENNO|nr:hypothetical protein KFK09_028553 [Dendrobium nobile]
MAQTNPNVFPDRAVVPFYVAPSVSASFCRLNPTSRYRPSIRPLLTVAARLFLTLADLNENLTLNRTQWTEMIHLADPIVVPTGN